MKYSLLSIFSAVLLFFSTVAYGQTEMRKWNEPYPGSTCDTFRIDRYIGGTWSADGSEYYELNANNYVDRYTLFDAAGKPLRQITFTRNASDQMTKAVLSTDYGGTLWIDSVIFTFTYQGGKLHQQVEEWIKSLTPTYENAYRYTYSYNANGDIETIYQDDWSGTDWLGTDNAYRYVYTYDSKNRLAVKFTDKYFASTFEYDTVYRTSYTYTAANKVKDELIEITTGQDQPPFTGVVRTIFKYDANDDLQTKTVQEAVQGGWLDHHLDSMRGYNQYTRYTYNGTTWDESERVVCALGSGFPPAVPVLTATATSWNKASVSWTNVADEDGYELQKSVAGDSFKTIATFGPDVTSHQDLGLAASTLYEYRVRAFNVSGPSAWSNEELVYTPAQGAVPAAPSGLGALLYGGVNVFLSWSDNSNDETGFRIYRSTDGVNYSPLIDVAATSGGGQSHDDLGLATSTTYWYKVVSFNGIGESDYSNYDSVTTGTVAINVPAQNDVVSIMYPNPAHGNITLKFTDAAQGQTQIRIMDITGKALYNENINQVGGASVKTIDISNIAAGSYILEVRSAKGVYTESLIVK